MLPRLGSLSGHVANIINAMCGLLQRDDLKNTLLLWDVGRGWRRHRESWSVATDLAGS